MIRRVGIIFGLLLALSGALVVSQASAQSDIESKLELCRNYRGLMEPYQKDFLHLAKVRNQKVVPSMPLEAYMYEEGERNIAKELSDTAREMGDYLWAVGDLLFVYERITKNADRLEVKPTVKYSLDHYAKQTQYRIEYVNNMSSYTKDPAITASATRFKKDLREIKTFLESIDLP